jgi:hypothetical protein
MTSISSHTPGLFNCLDCPLNDPAFYKIHENEKLPFKVVLQLDGLCPDYAIRLSMLSKLNSSMRPKVIRLNYSLNFLSHLAEWNLSQTLKCDGAEVLQPSRRKSCNSS